MQKSSVVKTGVVAIAITVFLFIGQPVASAGSNCEKLAGSGQIVQDFFAGTIEGPWELEIDGVMYEAWTTVEILQIKITEDGTQVATWWFKFDFDFGDTIEVVLHGVLSPVAPGEYRANAQGKILEGSGMFENSYGKIVIHGTFIIDFSTSIAYGDFTSKGLICDIDYN